MALIPWRPWFWRPWEELDDWFAAFGEPRRWREERWPKIKSAEFMLPVDIYEKGSNVVVETQIPGIDPAKVEVSVENNTLILKGKSEKKSEVEDKNYYRKEVHYGSFYRSTALPVKVVGNKAEASYEDGILKVIIPKAPATKGKTIKVKVKKSKS